MKKRRLLIGIKVSFVLILVFALFNASHQERFFPASKPLGVTPDWIATGEGEANNFGYSVSSAGDVNGDGYADIIVGADRYKEFTGRVHVYLGSSAGPAAYPIFSASGEDVNNHFGYSVGTAGDVNGDGYADIIVGAYHYKEFTGRAYLYAGNANGVDTAPLATFTGETPNIYFGRSVGTAGDVNGDGYDDVIIGAQAYDNWTGQVFVFTGSPNGLNATPIFTATGEGPSNSFGHSVGTAGDVNGDGYADIVVGAHGYADFTGRAYVYLGGADGLSPNRTFTIMGENINDTFGHSVSTAGDVNGDGYDDIVVGASHYNHGTGRVYVYVGGFNGLSTTPVFTATGEGENDNFGFSVGSAGDVNGDGFADVIVGAYQYNDFMGQIYVYFGDTAGLISYPAFTAIGESQSTSFGYSVSTAGDANGDGYDDIVIGATAYNNWTGRAYLYFGQLMKSFHP